MTWDQQIPVPKSREIQGGEQRPGVALEFSGILWNSSQGKKKILSPFISLFLPLFPFPDSTLGCWRRFGMGFPRFFLPHSPGSTDERENNPGRCWKIGNVWWALENWECLIGICGVCGMGSGKPGSLLDLTRAALGSDSAGNSGIIGKFGIMGIAGIGGNSGIMGNSGII